MTEVSGDGSAEITDKDQIEIELRYHLGDEAIMKPENGDFFSTLLGPKGPAALVALERH